MKRQIEDIEAAKSRLQELFKSGASRLFVFVSGYSGLTRRLRLFVVEDGDLLDVTYYVGMAAGLPLADSDGVWVVKVSGFGFCAAQHVTDELNYHLGLPPAFAGGFKYARM
jgi:hypothetical protein